MRRCRAINHKTASHKEQCKFTEGEGHGGVFYGEVCRIHAHQLWTSIERSSTWRFKVLTRQFKDFNLDELNAIIDAVSEARALRVNWVDIKVKMKDSYNRINK